MKRLVSNAYLPSIQRALELTGRLGQRLCFVDWFTGTDPVWAGLHSYDLTDDRRSYRTESHTVYPYHQRIAVTLRSPTIVLPKPRRPAVLVHELGHILDFLLGFDHQANPLTAYAGRDRFEAFAEAFTAWCIPGYTEARVDPRTLAVFESLEAAA